MKLIYLWIAFVVLSFVSLFVGVTDLRPWHLFSMNEQQTQVMLVSRIPRLVSIWLAGIGMSVAGLLMQQLARNKFVSPSTAGTTDAASLGALLSILLVPNAPPIMKIAIAFVFALLGTYAFMKLLDRIQYREPILIALVGLMFGSVIGAVTTFLALKYDLLNSINSWLNGDFSVVLKGRYETLYLSVPVIAIAYMFANRFTIAGMGEHFATNLGLHYRRVVNIGLLLVALVSSVVLLTIGSLPFLGLIIPNLVSLYRGDDLKSSLPHTALLGAVFVLGCDIIGRVAIFPYEIPIGLTVGVLGSAIFLYLLLRRPSYA